MAKLMKSLRRILRRNPFWSAAVCLVGGLVSGWFIAKFARAEILFTPLSTIKVFAEWLSPLLTSLWALVFLILTISSIFIFHHGFSNRVKNSLGRMSMEVGGVRIKIDDNGPSRVSIIELHKEARETLSSQYISAINSTDIDIQFLDLIKSVERILWGNSSLHLDDIKYRACLFVPSYTDGDLIQATEYEGTAPGRWSGYCGRIFSLRYGIIGKAFRTSRMQVNPEIGHDGFELVRDWGLTRSEAIDQSDVDKKHSMIAFPILYKTDSIPEESKEILDDQDAVGVVFIQVMSEVSQEFMFTRFGEHNEKLEQRIEFLNQILSLDEYVNLAKEIEQLNQKVRFDQKAFGLEGA